MNKIELYFHCKKCFKEKPRDKSMNQYSRTQTGRTPNGIQVWCSRHEEEIISFVYDWSKDTTLPQGAVCECCGCRDKI